MPHFMIIIVHSGDDSSEARLDIEIVDFDGLVAWFADLLADELNDLAESRAQCIESSQRHEEFNDLWFRVGRVVLSEELKRYDKWEADIKAKGGKYIEWAETASVGDRMDGSKLYAYEALMFVAVSDDFPVDPKKKEEDDDSC